MIQFYSTRTSCRSARKQQRKMWNLKKGNFREQPTIILNLKQIIEKFDKFKGYLFKFNFYNVYKLLLMTFFKTDDVKNMCSLLIKFEEFNMGRDLQTSLENLQTSILNNKSNIWPVFVSSN